MVITGQVQESSIWIGVLLKFQIIVPLTIWNWRKYLLTSRLERILADHCYTIMKEDALRAGDELIITEVDRLGRNKQETLRELQYYRDNGIRVKFLELPTTLMNLSAMDNAMARMVMETINNMLIELYATMAQAEIEKKEKRQKRQARTQHY